MSEMVEPGRALRAGAGAGVVATATMSMVMLAAKRLGFMGEQPPRRMTDVALDAVGQGGAPRWLKDGLATANHFAFGAALGAGFALAHRRYPQPFGLLPRGLVVASLVWFVSYQGWIPALGLMPPARRDQPGRPATMIVAHWAYGATLALCLAWWERRAAMR